VGVPGLLTPEAAALFPATRTECLDGLSEPGSFGGLPLNRIFQPGVDLGPLVAVIGANDPEQLRPRTPVRVEQGTADGTVLKPFTDQLVDEFSANSVPVTYKRYDGVDHGGVVRAAAGDATRWIQGRFR
jgi:fermentation-respiration switch protein FrsA (DUF1100 family)